MSKQSLHKLAVIALLASSSLCLEVQAKGRSTGLRPMHFQIAVNFECPLPELPNNRALLRHLDKLISQAKDAPAGGGSAFKFDLNGDSKPEYLVLLGSGFMFTEWAIYTTAPVRFLGVVSAQTLYLNKTANRWPRIRGLVRNGNQYKSFMDYCYQRGRYRECSNLKFIRDEKDIPEYFYKKPVNCTKTNSVR